MYDLVLEEIHKVQRGEVTPIAAANTIMDWCNEECEGEREEGELNGRYEQLEEQETDLQHSAFTMGMPDMFSDEMRWFWKV